MTRFIFYLIIVYVIYKIVSFFLKSIFQEKAHQSNQEYKHDFHIKKIKDITHRVKVINKKEKAN